MAGELSSLRLDSCRAADPLPPARRLPPFMFTASPLPADGRFEKDKLLNVSVWRCTLAPDGTWRDLQLLLPGLTGPPASWIHYNEVS